MDDRPRPAQAGARVRVPRGPRARPPLVEVVVPGGSPARSGNRMTARRYARILRGLGCRARVVERWSGAACDLLVALHARRGAASVAAFRARHPGRPAVVVLTGTDLYRDLARSAAARGSVASATRLVVLQEAALAALPASSRARARVIVQSAVPRTGRAAQAERGPRQGARARGSRAGVRGEGRARALEVLALAHLRPVKDPLLAARAVRLLPGSSRLVVVHAGGALDARLGERARRETARNPRWRWVGDLAHARALRRLARADLYLSTSRSEGGSLALAEALVAGVPVLATRIPASVAMLGARHPGLFPPGDARAPARLLERAERSPAFRARLRAAGDRAAPRFAPARERTAWRALLAEIGLRAPR